MKPQILLILGVHFILSASFHANAESERTAWLAERKKTIEEAKLNPNQESIEKLGLIASGLGRQKNLPPDADEILSDAKKALISIPGHADYFGDRIKAIADAEIAGTSTAHGGQRGWDFETLTQLQSPETVKVLGELLFDERNPFKDIHDDVGWRRNCMLAEEALWKLGLNNPPVNGPYIKYEEDLHTWQLWYQQVRAGTRTFSFKGDDKVYTLAGPVTEAKEPESSATKSAPSTAPQTAAVPQRPKWPLAVALVAAGVALFVLFRKTKRQSPSP